MDLRRITADYAVSPQIAPDDMPRIAAEGFVTVVCNRPDDEVPPELQSGVMRDAAEAAGLRFVDNPVVNGGLTIEMVEGQGRAVEEAAGPVFAYCRTGTRSAIIWALSQAGSIPTEEMISNAAEAGYDLTAMRGQIEALAGR